jgi:hypothetical protein
MNKMYFKVYKLDRATGECKRVLAVEVNCEKSRKNRRRKNVNMHENH